MQIRTRASLIELLLKIENEVRICCLSKTTVKKYGQQEKKKRGSLNWSFKIVNTKCKAICNFYRLLHFVDILDSKIIVYNRYFTSSTCCYVKSESNLIMCMYLSVIYFADTPHSKGFGSKRSHYYRHKHGNTTIISDYWTFLTFQEKSQTFKL